MPSYRGALVYKPRVNGSVYLAYGTSFNPSAESLNFIVNARGFGISNAFLAPEENETFEVGTKWNILNEQLSLTAAVFRLEKTNARVPILDAGLQLSRRRAARRRLRFPADRTSHRELAAHRGYTYLDSKIVEIGAGRRARRLAAHQRAEALCRHVHRIPLQRRASRSAAG